MQQTLVNSLRLASLAVSLEGKGYIRYVKFHKSGVTGSGRGLR
jgi:hypothetical protein